MRYSTILLLGVILLMLSSPALPNGRIIDQAAERLRNRIESADLPVRLEVGEELVYASRALPIFYEKRLYVPAWIDEHGPAPAADSLVVMLREAGRHGLRPNDYHLDRIVALIQKIRADKMKKDSVSIGRLVDLDLLLTDAFLIYGTHLLTGRINPITIDTEWHASLREVDMTEVLGQALADGSIRKQLQLLLPSQKGYQQLENALAEYRNIAGRGGWPAIPHGPRLQQGTSGNAVALLRRRLAITGEFTGQAGVVSDSFDQDLSEVVKRFQKRHGLEIDGIVGPKTRAALNIPVQERIDQIIINLERWRWLPERLGRRHIIINIANFELDVIEDEKIILDMKVIVGKTYRRTPVFSDQMTYLVFSPYWNIPFKIAVNDILSQARKDAGYLDSLGIRLFRGWGADMEEIDPRMVDWNDITAANFPYHIRQNPGPKNFLGGVKFMFPNQFNVYLHDTPAKELFAKHARGFSSGCIRIQKPIELVEYLMRDNPIWTRDKIIAAMNQGKEQSVRLPEPIPVHLLYWTSWVAPDGGVNFRDDIYNRDRRLLDELSEKPPRAP